MGFKGSVTHCKIVYKIFIVSRFLSLGYWKKFYTVGRTLDLVQDKFGFEFSLGHLYSLGEHGKLLKLPELPFPYVWCLYIVGI